VTSLELFAFVVLPVGVAASAWAIVLVAERRGAARTGCPRGKSSDTPTPR
jgi:hypothetical protein